LRILFLTKYYPPVEGGIERYSHMLCTSLVEKGFSVEVIAAASDGGSTREEVIDGVRVHRLAVKANISSTPITLGLPRLLRRMRDDFDLLHFNFPYPWTDVLYLAMAQNHKAVLTYHSDIFRRSGTFSGRLLQMYQPCIHAVLRRMPAIIATSPNIVEKSPFLFPNRDRCRVIPMPVDSQFFNPIDQSELDSVCKRYGHYILFVGRLVSYKGLSFLIEACAKLKDTNLVIVGHGPLEESHRSLVKKRGLLDRVFFLGHVSDAERLLLYHGCLCFALPSISHAEGFGIVQAEAMACAKPVISTELGTGTSYVNQDGITGFVVEPENAGALADKIDVLIDDEVLRRKMGERGLQRVRKEFTREKVVDQTIDLYADVLAGRNVAESR